MTPDSCLLAAPVLTVCDFKLLLKQMVVQPPLLLSTVTERSADGAVSSPAGQAPHGSLGFYN